jgi:TonB family protein
VLACVLATASAARSQEDAADVAAVRSGLEQGTSAKALKRATPVYPKDLERAGYEGWVVVTFVVKTDGSVGDVLIEDSSSAAFEQSTLDAVSRWRYEPATLDGTPVEQAYTSVRLLFRLEGGRPGGRSSFVRKFRELAEQIEEGDVDAAERKVAELSRSEALSLSERSYAALLEAGVQRRKGRIDRERRSLQRAVIQNGQFLERDAYANALSQLFLLELKQGDLGAALGSYARLSKLRTPPPELAALEKRARDAIAGSEPLGTGGRVALREEIETGEAPRIWSHGLLRRELSFRDVEGTLEAVEFRCSRHRARDEVITPDKGWRVPESWGRCSVLVFGSPGTTFMLVEHAPEPSSAPE